MISIKKIIQLFIKLGIYSVILVVVVVGITFGISLIFGTRPVVDVQAAESGEGVGQVQLQQELLMNVFKDKYPPETSFITPSASDAVNVLVTVLQNLSLSVVDGQPKYATNWPFGATLKKYIVGDNKIHWTVTADF